jgi:hypothetical protein
MSVYFIRLGQYVKVGFSDDPERRFRRLFSSATGYSAPWDAPRALADRTLLGYVHGTKDDEARAHDALSDFLACCEFYVAEQPVLDYVGACLSRGDVVTPSIPRLGGPAAFVGQIPPGADAWSLSDITAARRRAVEVAQSA